MQVIHFTEGATDPFGDFGARYVRFVPLATGRRDSDPTVSCFHLAPGARIAETPFCHDCALLLVQGSATAWHSAERLRLDLSGGMGMVLQAGEPFRLESETGAILLAVASPCLSATLRGCSSPDRVADQRWPGEPRPPRTLGAEIRMVGYRIRWWGQVTLQRLRASLAHSSSP